MPTTKDTKTVAIEKGARECSLDEYVTRACLEKNMGEILALRENAANARSYFVGSTIFNAVFDQDIALIKQIANRIDGSIPTSDERNGYANIFGDAIDDVLDYRDSKQMTIYPDDPPLVAMAKVLVYIATKRVGKNAIERKERAAAVEMIFERTGGRKVEPVRLEVETTYVDPKWMLLGGDADGDAAEEGAGDGSGEMER